MFNGISRRNWARNEGATFCNKRAMETQPLLKVTIPNIVQDHLLILNILVLISNFK
jgi:urocanate hydratase